MDSGNNNASAFEEKKVESIFKECSRWLLALQDECNAVTEEG